MEKIEYGGWKNCYQLSNGIVDLVVTGDVGPRIMRFGFTSGDNQLKEFPSMMGQTGGNEWRIYGGHRLWHAPEANPRTYSPDNDPVAVDEIPGGLKVTQKVELTTGIEKQISITLAADKATAYIHHTLHNRGVWPVQLAPWAITVLAPWGSAILPMPARGNWVPSNLLPTSLIALWPYTDPADPRFDWSSRYLFVHQQPDATQQQKVGLRTSEGWAAYIRDKTVFIKLVDPDLTRPYPDYGCTFEVYTDGEMLELESLGWLRTVAPGEAAEHREIWRLAGDIGQINSDDDVDRFILPHTARH